ncbi:hypothetical protein [Mesorhizobium sp. YR577]|uniref:hypothetical protein n=1 Tax=Mesorhizobium sp. YR577 TaxID=1884373 RepID=UPI0008EA8A7F|nr:hypothetical protein [Mesorhizobium sp. YR577]SFU22064.1 hypothetical protein SAMN05518861_13129 [Mesorhizobium sp. YR577]
MDEPLVRGAGQNESDRFLLSRTEQSFLNHWTYPTVYRDQKIHGDGNETLRRLIVCGDDVIAFSDKDIECTSIP